MRTACERSPRRWGWLPRPFRTCFRAAARRGITEAEAGLAIDVLARFQLIEKDENGEWRRLQEQVQAISAVAFSALRRFYAQMLNKCSEALETQTPRERESAIE